MAEEIFNAKASDGWFAESAGTQPWHRVCENVQKAMREIGINMDIQKPRKFHSDMAKDAYKIIVFSDAITPDLDGIEFIRWDVENCTEENGDCIRKGRDEIKKLVDELVCSLE